MFSTIYVPLTFLNQLHVKHITMLLGSRDEMRGLIFRVLHSGAHNIQLILILALFAAFNVVQIRQRNCIK